MSGIEPYAAPVYDDYGTMTVGEWGGYYVQILSMLYNNRLVLTPKNATMGYDHGWCYGKGSAAVVAAFVWDLDRDGEPPDYKKRATPGLRRAGGDQLMVMAMQATLGIVIGAIVRCLAWIGVR